MEASPDPSSPVALNNQTEGPSPEETRKQRRTAISIAVAGFLVLALIIVSLFLLLSPRTDANYVARLRDVFIIIMAFESILIGAVLVILILQLARLTNLIQNEVKPILDSTNETVSTLRGTTAFLSENLTEPIIKFNEYIAGLARILELFRIGQRKP